VPKVAYKRLAKHGNGVLVLIPAVMRHALSWIQGDFVELLLDETAGTITLRATHPRTVGPTPPQRVRDVADVPR
jgi:bifunctional DNA-binding transcriptional regulator/antitoxin component of YhaV-PrlF toxin-antitoxin module